MKSHGSFQTHEFEASAMTGSTPSNVDQSHRGAFGAILLIFVLPMLCAICGFVVARALGYAPF
jgi:hypothetical protein